MRIVVVFLLASFYASAQEVKDTMLVQRLTMEEPYSLQEVNGTYRFEVRPDDYVFNGNRAQIKTDTNKASFYSLDFKVEQFQYAEGEFFSLIDCHLHPKVARQNNKKGWGYRSAVSVILVRNKVVVGLRPMNNGKLKKLIKLPLDTGWMHFEMRIVWSPDADKGEVDIQLGDKRQQLKGIPTLYPDGKAPYFKFGVYRSAAYTDTCIVSYRRMRVDDQWIVPDFVKAAKGEGKGFKKNGIDKGMQIEKYEEHLKRSENPSERTPKEDSSSSAPSSKGFPEDENKKK
jgi:hypothetical protein